MDFEKIRDELELMKRRANLWENRESIDQTTLTKKDFGLNTILEVYAGQDRGGVTSDDIQKALEKLKPHTSQKETLARQVLYDLRRKWAQFKIWCIRHGFLPNPDYFDVPHWLAPLLEDYVGLVNPGGKVVVHGGEYPITGTMFPYPDTLIEGVGTATVFYPTADNDVFRIIPRDTNMYNVWINSIYFYDKNTKTTSTGAIKLANNAGKIFFPMITKVRIQNFRFGIYTDNAVADPANMVIIPIFREIQIETPRDTNMFLYNTIDTRVNNLWIGPSYNQANPQIQIEFPASTSAGHYWTDVTIMKEAAWTIGDGIHLIQANETFWKNTIVDRPDGHAIRFEDSSRSKFWMFFGITCGGSAIYIDATSGLNYFFSPILMSCTRYGIESLATGIDGNVFIHPYFENCVMGNYTFAVGSRDYLEYNRTTEKFINRDIALDNNLWLKWIHSGGTPEQVLNLGPTDEVTLKSTRGTVHINPDVSTNTTIAFNNSGQVLIGQGGANRPTLIQLGTVGNIELHAGGEIDAYTHINMQPGQVIKHTDVQVVSNQQAAIPSIGASGVDSDANCRARVNLILTALRTHGLIAT